MRNILLAIFIAQAIFGTACTKKGTEPAVAGNPANTGIEKGMIKGRITDSKGNPIANAKVVIEHTVYYGTYIYAISDDRGYYKTNVPNGSWQASVQIQRNYLGRTYTFDLHPDNAEPFAGTAGALRNFTWKLSGAKPAGGFYGSSLAVYPEPGSDFFIEDLELTLRPEGPLADGSAGEIISRGLEDIGGGEDGIRDVPVGKYLITARNKSTGMGLQIRMRNTGTYSGSVTGTFTPGFTGSTSYQMVVQVK